MSRFEGRFSSLPLDADDTWQGGIISLSEMGIGIEENAGDPGMVVWCSVEQQVVHARPFDFMENDEVEALLVTFLELANKPEITARPGRIECNDRELATGLKKGFGRLGSKVFYVEDMLPWLSIVDELEEKLCEGFLLPTLSEAGCAEQHIREYADAAADYFRASIWNYLDDTDLIQIELTGAPDNMRFAVILGAASNTYGIGFYEDEDTHYDLMAQRADVRLLNLVSITFDSAIDERNSDLSLWRELDLPLETGDAFPSMNAHSPDGPRRPTEEELQFATAVMQALGDTTEDEIDSGRWTKQVNFFGRTIPCTLRIPNLLDPPDRSEWMRRGLMPDRRGTDAHMKMVQEFISQDQDWESIEELNAAINDRFSGPIPQVKSLPTNAAERADAFYQQALDAFGRLRVVLAKKAVKEDPNHLDSSILLAESQRFPEHRIELFRAAKQLGEQQLGAQRMQDDVGNFWSIIDTRAYMRACAGLACALEEAGHTGEAIIQNLELLRLNPNDNQGIRYTVVPLLLTQGRDAQAAEILQNYDEDSASWHYTNTLIEFRCNGASMATKKAMRSAFEANPYVVQLLLSDEPPEIPSSYTVGSPEEAANCISELTEAWTESEGFVTFMIQEFSVFERDASRRRRSRKRGDDKGKGKRKK